MDLVSRLSEKEERQKRFRLKTVSPDDGKYYKEDLAEHISEEAIWKACAFIQYVLLETRAEFGKATQEDVNAVQNALEEFDPLNAALIEGHKSVRHDQLAVIEEIGRHVNKRVKSLLHPGTTSYDILDTARSYKFKQAWFEIMRPKAEEIVVGLCNLADDYINILQAGRTHLQRSSPILFGGFISKYAVRIAERIIKTDAAFNDLRGKISGIVGTGASIDMVIGEGTSIEYERRVIEDKLGLKRDRAATQIVQKENLADVGHNLVILDYILGDFSEDMRILYSSEINEVTSRDSSKRLGGSSADASKDNPINWENIAGKNAVVESGMRVLYAMVVSNLQRDLKSSVQARYQPPQMMMEVYESLCRASKSIGQVSVNTDKMSENLQFVRDFPSEAMTSITRGEAWIHPEYGVGHSAVKEFSKLAKTSRRPLLEVAMEDDHFRNMYNQLPENKKKILNGKLEFYLGSEPERTIDNIQYSKDLITLRN